MPLLRAKYPGVSRRAIRWLLPAALLALVPKCVLCVLAYVGVGAALGVGGPEWCGAEAGAPISWTTMLAWAGAGVVLVFVTLRLIAGCRGDRKW